MALRQTSGFVERLLRLVGPDRAVPDFGIMGRRRKTPAVNVPRRGSQDPLHLPIPSRALLRDTLPGGGRHRHRGRGRGEGEGEWNARGHGGPKRRPWRKIHIGIDGQTPQIRAIHCRQVIATRSPGGRLPEVTSVMRRCRPNRSTGSPPTRRSDRIGHRRPCRTKRAWDSHCGSSGRAGRPVQARAHPLRHAERVRLRRRAVQARVADGPLTGRVSRSDVPRGWFDASTPWHGAPSGKRGGQAGPWRRRDPGLPDRCPAGHHAVMSREGSRCSSACRFGKRRASLRAF